MSLEAAKAEFKEKVVVVNSDHMFIFLYCGFREEAFYWEFIVLGRKIAINFVLLISESPLRLAACSAYFWDMLSATFSHAAIP